MKFSRSIRQRRPFSDIPTLDHLPTNASNSHNPILFPRFPPIHSTHHHNNLYDSLNQFKPLMLMKMLYPQRPQPYCALYFQRKRVKYRSGTTDKGVQ
jgi:hypothetical protein